MPPKLISDDGKQIVIRPLAYCKEKDIEKYAQAKQFPIIPCNLCGSQPNLQRQVVEEMLNTWDRQYPGRLETMFGAMQNITLSHMLDPKLFDFKSIKRGQTLDGLEGDIAFDQERITPMQLDDEEQMDLSKIAPHWPPTKTAICSTTRNGTKTWRVPSRKRKILN